MKRAIIAVALCLAFIGALHAGSEQDAINAIAGIIAYPTICHKELSNDHLASAHIFGLSQGIDTDEPEIQTKIALRASGYIDDAKNNPRAVPQLCRSMDEALEKIDESTQQLKRALRNELKRSLRGH